MNGGWRRAGKLALVGVALAALALPAADAWARGGSGGHGGRSSHCGGKSGTHRAGTTHNFHGSRSSDFYGGYWAGPAYWPDRRVAYVPAEPVRFIERSEEELQTDSAWFYCENDRAYYPRVTKCPGGWVKVTPPIAQ